MLGSSATGAADRPERKNDFNWTLLILTDKLTSSDSFTRTTLMASGSREYSRQYLYVDRTFSHVCWCPMHDVTVNKDGVSGGEAV